MAKTTIVGAGLDPRPALPGLAWIDHQWVKKELPFVLLVLYHELLKTYLEAALCKQTVQTGPISFKTLLGGKWWQHGMATLGPLGFGGRETAEAMLLFLRLRQGAVTAQESKVPDSKPSPRIRSAKNRRAQTSWSPNSDFAVQATTKVSPDSSPATLGPR